jgi:hypothetical protein
MDIPYAQGDYYGSVMEGWFIPPATTTYKFYMACDDNCELFMNNETSSNDTYSPKIAENFWSTDYRDFWEVRGSHQYTRKSEWIALNASEPYYIKGVHMEHAWGDHFTVGVEIN